MLLSARAEYLSDLSELAARCAVCFTAARCAGADVKAIGPTAKAAVILGADWKWLHSDGPAYDEDTLYLRECESIRHAIRLRAREARLLERDAERAMRVAEDEMWRAVGQADWPRYYLALREWQDAHHAAEACRDILSRLDRADRALAEAPLRYADVYEEPVAFAAKGGLLPYDGRWIDGEKPKPTVRWHG